MPDIVNKIKVVIILLHLWFFHGRLKLVIAFLLTKQPIQTNLVDLVNADSAVAFHLAVTSYCLCHVAITKVVGVAVIVVAVVTIVVYYCCCCRCYHCCSCY